MTAEKIKREYSDETRLALLEQSTNNTNNTLLRMESEARTHHRWTMGSIFGLYTIILSSLAGIVIKLVH